MNDFADHLAAERRAAVRLLLTEPLVTAATHPDEFPLVRRHADELAARSSRVTPAAAASCGRPRASPPTRSGAPR